MKKRIISLLMAVVTVLSLAVPAFAAETYPYTDVPENHWGRQYILRAYEDGAMVGTGGNFEDGTAVFSPDAQLAGAQLLTLLLRAFFPESFEKYSDVTNPWYAPYIMAAKDMGLVYNTAIDWDSNEVGNGINRFDMSAILHNAMLAAKVPELTAAEYSTAKARIPDINSNAKYEADMVACVHYGIITGIDPSGTFYGEGTMTRAQAAIVYCRMADLIDKYENDKGNTGEDVKPPVEEKPPVDVKPAGAVGTMSDETVTLSLDTHAPVVDYWSSLSSDIKALTDKDSFNAAMQTYMDREMIMNEGTMVRGINKNYNYACYEFENNEKQYMLTYALGAITSGYCGGKRNTVGTDADGRSIGVVDFGYNVSDAKKLDEIFAPIFAKFTPGMSDYDKVALMVNEMENRFSYKSGTSFSWTNGKTTGVCDDYKRAFADICSAAGIPVLSVGSAKLNHAWNLVYIDGDWYYVDVTTDSLMTFRPQEEMIPSGYGIDGDSTKVAKAIIELAHS